MRIFRSESLVDYRTYTFNYAIYCIKESDSEISAIYDMGFLPYSNNVNLEHETYYLARSLRVELERFSASSENRRVARNIEVLAPSFRVVSARNFDLKDADFKKFCLDYATKRFSEKISSDRLDYILGTKSISHVFEFLVGESRAGYVIAILQSGTLHYWFAFYDLKYTEYSLGKWMMYSVIAWAQEQNMEYVYLGTCYGEKSLYKVRDFKGLSYFDGNRWDDDMKFLKAKCKADSSFRADAFKQDVDLFLERLPFSN